MGCAFVGLSFILPRVAFVVVLLAGHGYLDRAFPEGWHWPLLGFFLMPTTTLAYAFATISLGEPGVLEPWGWVLVALAALLDLGAIAHAVRTWRRRRGGDRRSTLPPLPPMEPERAPATDVPERFADRVDAGRQLAELLEPYRGPDTIVLGLPRGGVAVAAEVARALDAPLDVFVVRKIGAPMQPELGIGAVAEGGERWIDARLASRAGASDTEVGLAVERETIELERRVRLFRGQRALPALAGKTVIVVDDGLATGSTDRVALRAIRKLRPARLVLAVPVAATDGLHAVGVLADDVVCVLPREDLGAVGWWYRNFEQTTDPEVVRLLAQSPRPHAPTP